MACGVMVAQEFLALFVKVRVLTSQLYWVSGNVGELLQTVNLMPMA